MYFPQTSRKRDLWFLDFKKGIFVTLCNILEQFQQRSFVILQYLNGLNGAFTNGYKKTLLKSNPKRCLWKKRVATSIWFGLVCLEFPSYLFSSVSSISKDLKYDPLFRCQDVSEDFLVIATSLEGKYFRLSSLFVKINFGLG